MVEEKRRQIISTALGLFWKYGFRRVNMKEIAEAAGISRPGLYLYFRTKEAVFSEAIKHYAEDLLEEIDRGMQGHMTPAEKLRFVFEVWAVRGFAEFLKSPEMRELTDTSLGFAREAFEESYAKLVRVIASVLQQYAKTDGARKLPPPARTARILASAVRGFKHVAANPADLQKMIEDHIKITLGPG
jgi:TetR/AcrR family transcriptional regulator of autoinduction and epiphytic fitness